MDVVVETGPPVSELRVVLGIGVDLVESTLHASHRLAVGESLNKSSELDSSVVNLGLGLESIGRLGALANDVLGVLLVVYYQHMSRTPMDKNLLSKKVRSHSMASW